MILTELVHQARETAKLKQLFRERAEFMKPGTYALSPDLKLVYRIDADTISYVNRYFGVKHETASVSIYRRMVLMKLGNATCKIEKNESNQTGGGTVYYTMPAKHVSGKPEAKVFNFEDSEVLTLYEEDHHVYKYATNDTYFRDFFQLPAVNHIDLNNRICAEEFVPYMLKKNWTFAHYDIVTARLFSSYYEYAQTCGEELTVSYANVKAKLARIRSDTAFKETAALLETALPDPVKQAPFPHIRQHGDMHSDNVLISHEDGETVYFIDWDQSMKYLLGFDLLHWFTGEIEERNEPHKIGLIDYFYGDFDPYFDKLFRSFGFFYNDYSRKDYYLMFLTEKIYRKELVKKRAEKNRSAEMHNELITRITELEIS